MAAIVQSRILWVRSTADGPVGVTVKGTSAEVSSPFEVVGVAAPEDFAKVYPRYAAVAAVAQQASA